MNEPRPQRCRSCGADVFWAQWRGEAGRDGQWIPVDAVADMRPAPRGGSIVLALSMSSGRLMAEKWRPAHGPTRNRYTAHWATCPQAGEWRRRQSEYDARSDFWRYGLNEYLRHDGGSGDWRP